MIVIANKADDVKNIEVSKREIRKFEEEHKVWVFECSAKTSEGVTEAFLTMAKQLISEDKDIKFDFGA